MNWLENIYCITTTTSPPLLWSPVLLLFSSLSIYLFPSLFIIFLPISFFLSLCHPSLYLPYFLSLLFCPAGLFSFLAAPSLYFIPVDTESGQPKEAMQTQLLQQELGLNGAPHPLYVHTHSFICERALHSFLTPLPTVSPDRCCMWSWIICFKVGSVAVSSIILVYFSSFSIFPCVWLKFIVVLAHGDVCNFVSKNTNTILDHIRMHSDKSKKEGTANNA